MKYKTDKDEIFIWKFYLKKLIDDTESKPCLRVELNKNQVIDFWDELKLKFMPN